MKLSLSKREKVLIVASLIAIILFVYMSLVRPGLNEKLESQESLQANLKIQILAMENAPARLARLEEEIQVMEAYVEAELPFYFGTDMQQENVLLLVRDLLEASQIDAYELSLDEEGSSRLRDGLESFYKQSQTEKEPGQSEAESVEDAETMEGVLAQEAPTPIESWTAPPVRMISVTMRFRSSYPAMMNFIRSLSDHAKVIGIESLTLDGGGEDRDRPLEGNIRIFLPALEMVEARYPTSLPDDLERGLELGDKKENPFDQGGIYTGPEDIEEPSEEAQETVETDQP